MEDNTTHAFALVENVNKRSEVLRVRLYLPGDNVKSRLSRMRAHISKEENILHFMKVTCFILYCILATVHPMFQVLICRHLIL